jgi:hypothetical protein
LEELVLAVVLAAEVLAAVALVVAFVLFAGAERAFTEELVVPLIVRLLEVPLLLELEVALFPEGVLGTWTVTFLVLVTFTWTIVV